MPRKRSSKSPLLQKLTGPAAARYGALPKIPLPGDNELQGSFNRDVAHVLQGSSLYRRATIPVHPFEGTLCQMTPAKFISWSQQYFVPYKTKLDRDQNPIQVLRDMTESVAKLTLESFELIAALPKIHRIYPSPVPVITDQGTLILCTPGYDPTTGTYVFESTITQQDPDPARPPITTAVTSDNYFDDSLTIADAFWDLYELYEHFPFNDWSDYITPGDSDILFRLDAVGNPKRYRTSRSLSVQIGAMLALFARNCVPHDESTMGFGMNANSQRSGKTLLVKIATAPVFGTFKSQGWRKDDEAMTKLLDSEILMASPYICFDNVRDFVQSDKLESLFTAPLWTGRVLGKTETFTEENNTTVFITGNNLNMGTDMLHRCLMVDLYVEESDVQSRKKAETIINDTWLNDPTNRRRLLSDLWAIVRHWDAAGRPLTDIHKTRLGFETWGQIIGGMVEFAMFGDMLERPVLANAGDSEMEDIHTLVRHLHEQGRNDYTFQEIVHLSWDNGLFPWNLSGREEYKPLRPEAGCEHITTLTLDGKGMSKMGILLKRHATEKGTLHTIREDSSGRVIKVRFWTRGSGRHKRYFVSPA